jgi:hypothetical protein
MEKWKEQFRMDTPEKLAKLGAQDQDKQNTTIHKMLKIKTTTKTHHNMCWTPPYTRRRQNTPQYVLDTTIHKAKTKQTTICVEHHHTQGEDKTNHNLCWTPPCTRRRQNTPQYVLDTTIHKAKTKHNT